MASALPATPSSSSSSSFVQPRPQTPPKRLRRSTRTPSRIASSPPMIAFPSRSSIVNANAPPSPPLTRADLAAELRGEAFCRRRFSISSFDSMSSEAPSLSSSCSTSSRSSSIASLSSCLLSPLPGPSAPPSAQRPTKATKATDEAPSLGDGVRSMSLFTLIAFDESSPAPLSLASSRRIPSPPHSPPRPRSLKRFSDLRDRDTTPPADARLVLGPAIASRRHPRPASISVDSSSLTRPAKRRSIIRASEALARAVS